MDNFRSRICKLSGVVWKQYNSLQKCNCDECRKLIPAKVYVPKKFNNDLKLKPIYKPPKKVSDKRKIENLKYSVLRIEFLSKPENKICPVTGWEATEIHHKKGRVGDLFLDTNFWLAVSREGHIHIEENTQWAKEKGFSLDRLSKKSEF